MRSFLGRQTSGSTDAVVEKPTVNPTVVVYAPSGVAGPIALVDVARARAGGSDEAIIVERASGGVRVRHGLRAEVGLADRDRPQRIEAQCILGIVCVGENAFYVVSVLESDEVIRRNVLGPGSIRNIRRVAFTPLDPQAAFVLDGSRPGQSEPSLASKIVAQLRSDLEDEHGFYFSAELDVTATLQRQAAASARGSGGGSGESGVHARAADARFYWNAQMLHPFAVASVDEPWLCPAMRGHVGCAEGRMCGNRLAYAAILVSRRSCEHAGTRYHTRGSNDDGHAANFVETENIVVVVRMPGQAPAPGERPLPQGPWRASWVQTRGSVPLFWSQSGMQYKPKPVLHRTPAQNTAVLQRHLAAQAAVYGEPIGLVSLLNLTSDEADLAAAFQLSCGAMQAQQGRPVPRACYLPFDFHTQTKGGKLQAVYAFAEQIVGPALQRHGGPPLPHFFLAPRPGQPAVAEQEGVLRTNCLDCLDRTNVVQHCFARLALAKILEQARKDMVSSADSLAAGAAGSSWEAECVRVADGVQKLWADNGHALSLQYAGTASLKSAMLKAGPETDAAEPQQPQSRLTAAAGLASSLASLASSKVTDGASSLQRYYVSNFKDDVRQQAVDALLAPVPGTSAYVRAPPAGAALDYDPPPPILRLLVASWNVNGKGPKEDGTQAIVDWVRSAYPQLGPSEQPPPPDVVVFGMQELIALDVKHALTADVASRIALWRTAMGAGLQRLFAPQGASFDCVESKNMFGVQMWLFVNARHSAHMSRLVSESVKIGFGGTVGNKGGIGMRFRLYDRSICLINAHLPSGSKEVEARNGAYGEILTALHASIRFGRDCRVLEHDLVVWFGDLNYRVALPNEQVRNAVTVQNYYSILEHDQLTLAREHRLAFAEFEEALIRFAPTYKYDTGTDDFDSSEKQRVPSWTDRVLYRGEGVRCASYVSSMALKASDHKPICSLLELAATEGSAAERAARNARSKAKSAASGAPLPAAPPLVDLLGGMDDSDDESAGGAQARVNGGAGNGGGQAVAGAGGHDPFGFGGGFGGGGFSDLSLDSPSPSPSPASAAARAPGAASQPFCFPSQSSFASDSPSDGAAGPQEGAVGLFGCHAAGGSGLDGAGAGGGGFGGGAPFGQGDGGFDGAFGGGGSPRASADRGGGNGADFGAAPSPAAAAAAACFGGGASPFGSAGGFGKGGFGCGGAGDAFGGANESGGGGVGSAGVDLFQAGGGGTGGGGNPFADASPPTPNGAATSPFGSSGFDSARGGFGGPSAVFGGGAGFAPAPLPAAPPASLGSAMLNPFAAAPQHIQMQGGGGPGCSTGLGALPSLPSMCAPFGSAPMAMAPLPQQPQHTNGAGHGLPAPPMLGGMSSPSQIGGMAQHQPMMGGMQGVPMQPPVLGSASAPPNPAPLPQPTQQHGSSALDSLSAEAFRQFAKK